YGFPATGAPIWPPNPPTVGRRRRSRRAPFQPDSLLAAPAEDRPRGHEVGGVESLGEPAVDGRQGPASLGRAARSVVEPRPAGRAAELPRQRVLASSEIDGLPEEVLGRGGGIHRVRAQEDLALDAEQLGDVPKPVVLLG